MKRFCVILALLPVLSTGCTHNQLRRSTSMTQASMSDLRYKHILDNLAMMVRNPATVPNPVAINGGVVQISDNGTGLGNITWNPLAAAPPKLYNIFFGLTGSRTVSEQWSLTPLHNPEKLRLMRYTYQLLLNSDLGNFRALGTRGGVGFLAPLLLALGIVVIIFGTLMVLVTRRGVPRNPLRFAWAVVSVVGVAVVALVLGLNLFPRLIGGQTLLDDMRPFFALDRIQGDRAGIEFIFIVVDALGPAVLPALPRQRRAEGGYSHAGRPRSGGTGFPPHSCAAGRGAVLGLHRGGFEAGRLLGFRVECDIRPDVGDPAG